MKKTIAFLIMIGFAATLGAQSLVELARLEKERRKSLGGRRAYVVTNLDLLRVKKRPAVEVVVPEEEIIEEPAEGVGSEEAALDETAPPEAEAAAPPPVEAEPAPIAPGTGSPEAELPNLEEKLLAAEELIDLLETKIAALNQDYRYQTNMVPNYVIEQQLTETLLRLQNAQADTVRLRREIDKASREKKLAASPIR